ncbi:MAG: hypothetical protein K1X67_15200 [Fimbriimonadaceae bacterium]|nr:hypothetical protein [Fimbriimonadaceae bacterium]
MPVTLPSDGTYFTTMTLEEYTSSGWVIRRFVAFNSTSTFGNPGSGGGGDRPNSCLGAGDQHLWRHGIGQADRKQLPG